MMMWGNSSSGGTTTTTWEHRSHQKRRLAAHRRPAAAPASASSCAAVARGNRGNRKGGGGGRHKRMRSRRRCRRCWADRPQPREAAPSTANAPHQLRGAAVDAGDAADPTQRPHLVLVGRGRDGNGKGRGYVVRTSTCTNAARRRCSPAAPSVQHRRAARLLAIGASISAADVKMIRCGSATHIAQGGCGVGRWVPAAAGERTLLARGQR